MNYNTESKIWRVGGPLFVYLGITYAVKLIYSIWIFYEQFNIWDINAAFNGLLYTEELKKVSMSYTLIMSGVAIVITIPVLLWLMKKDFEYPVNLRQRERVFQWNKYCKGKDFKAIPVFILLGAFATLGLSRVILMLPIDGILGDYGATMKAYGMSSPLIQVIVLGILSPIVEEILFRGLVYKRLKVYYEATIAAYISAIIFEIAHFNLIQGLYAFIMGIIFAFVYEKYKSIFAPIIVHLAANIVAVVTGCNPISQFIDRYWIIRLAVGICFIIAFSLTVLYLNKRSEQREK